MNGIVYLTGAGPGDYRLLTLKAATSSVSPTSSSYDYLADERLLDFARPDAKKYTSAKKPPTTPSPKRKSSTYSLKKPVPERSSSASKGATPSSSAAAEKKAGPSTTPASPLKSFPA